MKTNVLKYVLLCATLLGIGFLVRRGITAPGPLDIAQAPLFTRNVVPPLNMLVMGRDHKLYYEAYNDASDLDGDGVLDVGYKPDKITYYGYYNSNVCYRATGDMFQPVSVAQGSNGKKCAGTWSGDFLNYLTTSRMDALRKVLFGGYREVDTPTQTILRASFTPQDAHSWGKEYAGVPHDGYDISEYAPLSAPSGGHYHLFAVTTLSDNGIPQLRVLADTTFRVWNWVSIEQPVAGSDCFTPQNQRVSCMSGGSTGISDYPLRVETCSVAEELRESNCKLYQNNTSYKPTGILHDYGENDRMYFGLLTGSYQKNITGGVLHSNVSSFSREVNQVTGQFCLNGNCGSGKDVKGIVHTISSFRMLDFSYKNHTYGCGWITTRPVSEGECWMWGNPIAEMMYETLRYFGGATAPRIEYDINDSSQDIATLQLSHPSWKPPYTSVDQGGGGYSLCAQPTMTVFSDINPSYDYKLPGSRWSNFNASADPASLRNLDVSAEADRIWADEGGGSKLVFIGESNNNSDNAPTPKVVSNLSTVRGLAPEEPSKRGTYYSAAVARYGANHKIGGSKFVRTYAVALASPLPKFEFPVGNGRVSLVPFAKSVRGAGISPTGNFQPTNQIVDFYVQRIANMAGSSGMDYDATVNGGRPYAEFRINYEDVEQGADHDMDVIVLYTISVDAKNQLVVTLKTEYSAGTMDQHMGYVISGTTQDGVYLEVCDLADGHSNDGTRSSCAGQQAYKLNTPPDHPPGYCNAIPMPGDCNGLPPVATRTFAVASQGTNAVLLKDPLWYAAKYGHDQGVILDSNGALADYFPVNNPLYLRKQVAKAFAAIQNQAGSSGSVAVVGTSVSSTSFAVIPSYSSTNDGKDWTGEMTAYRINPNGMVGDVLWLASAGVPSGINGISKRLIYTALSNVNETNRSSVVRPFVAEKLVQSSSGDAATDAAEVFGHLGYTARGVIDDFGSSVTPNQLVNYLRGDKSMEGVTLNSAPFRRRFAPLGDIINSIPVVATRRANYGWATASGLPQVQRDSYSAFIKARRDSTAAEHIFVGANDGMLHAFDDKGTERFAYVPNSVLHQLGYLANRDYQHRYYVDGKLTLSDAYLGGGWKTVLVAGTGAGGRSMFALDVSSPTTFAESNVLWEINSQNDDDMGYTMGKPYIVPLQDGSWAAIFGNGYNSSNGRAVLFIVNLATGQLIRKIEARDGIDPDGTDPANMGYNGLGNLAVLDTDGDGLVDMVYGADLHGNLWKFNLMGKDPENWGIAYKDGLNNPMPLFVARDAKGYRQSITGGLEVAVGPNAGYMIYFGSGRYFVVSDNSSKDLSTLYGIWDSGSPVTAGRAALSAQMIQASDNPTSPDTRIVTRNQLSYMTKRGWYVDLVVQGQDPQGERSIAAPLLQGGRVFFSTYVPGVSVNCAPGGSNWLYALDATTGGAALGQVNVPSRSSRSSVGNSDTGAVSTGGDAPIQSIAVTRPMPKQPVFCNPGEDDCPLVPEKPAGPVDTRCSEVIIDPNDPTKSISVLRACGRQSWRQLR
ncbi:pilus assembly protein [Xylella taiwanensis]|uniref:Fimbrial assembly protein n=1 Tax=Xylella taiwanensis TaxID=1444770 RepID=Z9JMK8_9GAMM|nr:pilus assembly protein [Xylella taiwanensis]AXI84090.1 fimbrial protein [Xylella taiwanensis]EWS78992.1 fimbrial assembly protein [Xylella taiwanensis]MCD8457208.1 pilus assembly protein [Xylella taiwanensis]MCD8459617.1 pilus assembly protein [Xylella taiwanensis]MCD8461516.1 pilus assembly protein [Xylella taiwanensis]